MTTYGASTPADAKNLNLLRLADDVGIKLKKAKGIVSVMCDAAGEPENIALWAARDLLREASEAFEGLWEIVQREKWPSTQAQSSQGSGGPRVD